MPPCIACWRNSHVWNHRNHALVQSQLPESWNTDSPATIITRGLLTGRFVQSCGAPRFFGGHTSKLCMFQVNYRRSPRGGPSESEIASDVAQFLGRPSRACMQPRSGGLTLGILWRRGQHFLWRLWGASALHCLFFLTNLRRVRPESADRRCARSSRFRMRGCRAALARPGSATGQIEKDQRRPC